MSNSYFLTFIYIELGVFNGAKNGIGFETMDKFYKFEGQVWYSQKAGKP